MIATGPPQSASCVVANSRSAVTSDLSGRSATSRTVHWSGWDLLTCVSSGIGVPAPTAPGGGTDAAVILAIAGGAGDPGAGGERRNPPSPQPPRAPHAR